jgi:hypothetical protein
MKIDQVQDLCDTLLKWDCATLLLKRNQMRAELEETFQKLHASVPAPTPEPPRKDSVARGICFFAFTLNLTLFSTMLFFILICIQCSLDGAERDGDSS